MENLIGKPLKRKQFAEVWNLDHTLKKDLWRTEVKKADQFCKWHTVGKGAGTKYYIDEIFEAPKERIHGNTGNEPWNKGVVDDTSMKYKLAEALILTFAKEDATKFEYQPKRSFMQILDCHFQNFNHVKTMFYGKQLESLDAFDRFVLKLSNNTSKSVNWMLDSAFDLIRKGTFDGVTLQEEVWIACFDHQHYQADELENCNELYDLYKQARVEAEENVNKRNGEFLYFSMKTSLVNAEYHELIETEEKYQLLYDNEIDYMYKRYAIEDTLNKSETAYDYEALNYDGSDLESGYEGIEIANEFIAEFQVHREELAIKAADKFLNSGTIGILNEHNIEEFAEYFTVLLFGNVEYEDFQERYERLENEVRQIKNTGFGYEFAS